MQKEGKMHGQQVIVKKDTAYGKEIMDKTKNKAIEEIKKAKSLLCITVDSEGIGCTSSFQSNHFIKMIATVTEWIHGGFKMGERKEEMENDDDQIG
jgi:hypothetical protein